MHNDEQITFFAKTDARGQQVPFGIKAKDRTKHVYVIGKTGMGKSTLLENMAVQDIQQGNGLAFIDPHGATAETLLDYIPEERLDDVLYFAPFDTNHPISFNVMEDVGPDKRHLVVSGLMSVFKKIWVDAWSARMEYILSNTLLALLEYPDSTLLGVNRMLSDKHYRKAVVSNITDPAVKSFWVDEFANYNERYMQEAGDAIKNKIGQFTSNPLIRNIVGQPKSSFDLRKVMDEKKILIANLSKGLVGESNANLLGSMLTTRIYLAAMSRADLPAQTLKETPNYYFYVDEFQSFANATFADILSEARKYKLNLTIAHQYIEQMEEEVRNAVFGNVGTIIAFRVGPFDAEILETIFTPKFLAADIVNLGFAQVYLTLMIDGIGSHPFSAVTLPPIEAQRVTYKDMVIARSRARYAKERGGVESKINAWHEQIYDEKKLAYEAEKAARIAAGEKVYTRDDYVAKEAKKKTFSKGKPPAQGQSRGNEGRRESPPRDQQQRTPQKPPQKNEPPKEKSLDELRSVLKNIAAPAKKADETNKKQSPHSSASQKRNDTHVKGNDDTPPAPKADLHNAVHSALKKSTPQHNKKPVQPSSEKNEQSTKHRRSPEREKAPRSPQATQASQKQPHSPSSKPPETGSAQSKHKVTSDELKEILHDDSGDSYPLR